MRGTPAPQSPAAPGNHVIFAQNASRTQVSAANSIPAERLRWLASFEAQHGRPLRVLHVGNIANNGYLNAKFLRSVGVDAHVLSHDYFHMMACPEWEEIEITEPYGDDNAPLFSPIDLKSYRRPEWFFQDSFQHCLEAIADRFLRNAIFSQDRRSTATDTGLSGAEYALDCVNIYIEHLCQSIRHLESKLDLARQQADHVVQQLNQLHQRTLEQVQDVSKYLQTLPGIVAHLHQQNSEQVRELFDQVQKLPGAVAELLKQDRQRPRFSPAVQVASQRAVQLARKSALLRAIYRYLGIKGLFGRRFDAAAAITLPRPAECEVAQESIDLQQASVLQEPMLPEPTDAELPGLKAAPEDPDQAAQAIAEFAGAFPERPDQLTVDDVRPYLPIADSLRHAFEQYDIIQYYSTHPLFGYLAGNKPYVAFEHGTLRTFTMDDNPLHRLTALGYRKADHVFITNGDCLDYARRLGVTKFSPMIHPIDVDLHRREHGIRRDEMKRRLNADVLLFCPLRHDWAIKGTDIHIKALPLVRARVSGRVVLVLIRWGAEVEASRALIAESRCSDCVVWTPPLSRITLVKLMQAADVVLDQIALPHFGATAPQALAAGTPVISSYEPESTAWIVNEPAPILSAFTAEEVAEAVIVALDPKWRASFNDRARHWVDAHHHQDRVITEHLRVYQHILERQHDERR